MTFDWADLSAVPEAAGSWAHNGIVATGAGKLIGFHAGQPDHILFGSDYPRSEGMAEPLSWLKQVADLCRTRDVARIMGENLYGLLAPIADPEGR
jgi:hypothetical protein